MSLEKRVVIRLLAETEVEKTKSAIAIFKRLKTQLTSVDRSAYNTGRSWKQYRSALSKATEMHKKYKAAADHALITQKKKKEADKAAKKALDEYSKSLDAAKEAQKRFRKEVAKLAGRSAFAGMRKGAGMYFGALKKGFGMALNAAKKMGVVLSGVAVASSYAYMNLRDEVAKIKIVFDEAGFSADSMLTKIMDLSEKSIFSATDLGSAMYDIAAAMGGLKVDELERMTELSSELAIASGFDDVNAAANLLMGTFRTFGDQQGDIIAQTEKMRLVLWKAAADTSLSIQDIGVAMQFVGGTAEDMDQDLENVLAGLGMLRNANMSASVASTSLNMVLTGMSAPSENASTWFRRLGVSMVDAEGNMREYTDVLYDLDRAFETFPWRDQAQKHEVLLEMFGVRGKRAATIFMKNMDESGNHLEELGDTFLDTADAAEEFEKRIEEYMVTPQATFKRMTNIVKNFGAVIGEALLMEEGADGEKVLAGWVKQIENLLASEGMKEFMKDLGIILNRIATVVVPILIRAFEIFGPIFMEVMDMVATVMEDERFQELIDAALSLSKAFGEKMVSAMRTLLPSLMKLLPSITKILVVLEKFIPLLDILILQWEIFLPFIEMGLDNLAMMLEVLAPFVPLLRSIGMAINKYLAIPMAFAAEVTGTLLAAVGNLVTAAGVVTQNLEWIAMGAVVRHRGEEMMETAQGMYGQGGVLTAGYEPQMASGNTYYYNFDTVIEGNADEDVMDRWSDDVVDRSRVTVANFD